MLPRDKGFAHWKCGIKVVDFVGCDRYKSANELSSERHLSKYFYSNVYNVDSSE